MKKTNRVYSNFLSLMLVSTLILTGFASEPVSPVYASYLTELQNSWNSFFRAALPRPFRGNRRDPDLNLCLISPFEEQSKMPLIVSSVNPTFFWTGNAEWIELRSSNGESISGQINLSEQKVRQSVQSITYRDQPIQFLTYEGEALQPGQTYSWIIKFRNLGESRPLKLRVMSKVEQDDVSKALRTLETEKLTGMTPEQKALRRADYFASQQLWSDFWQTVLSIQQPSPKLKTLLQSTTSWICYPPDEKQPK